MKDEANEYPVQRDRVARYLYWNHFLLIILVGIWFFGCGLLVAVIYAVTLGLWLTRQQAQALRYWLDGTTLRIDQGVFFLKRKAIPLDRVTDVVLAQGPLLRWCGIWVLNIQTAGMGHAIPEGILIGLDDPGQVRDELLKARDTAAGRSLT